MNPNIPTLSKDCAITVVYQSDDNYIIPGVTSIVSVLENNSGLKIYIKYISSGISVENQQKVVQLVQKYDNAEIEFIDGQIYHDRLTKLGVNSWSGKIIAWYKVIAIGDLQVETERVLYLNPHILCTGSLKELVTLPLDGCPIAMAKDYAPAKYKQIRGLSESDQFYNTGIILFDYKLWQEHNLQQLLLHNLTIEQTYATVDQGLINITFKNFTKELPINFNFWDFLYDLPLKKYTTPNKYNPYLDDYYSYEEIANGYIDPKLIYLHSNVTGRPWSRGSRETLSPVFNKYFALTGFDEATRPNAVRNTLVYFNKKLPLFVQNIAGRLFTRVAFKKQRKQLKNCKFDQVIVYDGQMFAKRDY